MNTCVKLWDEVAENKLEDLFLKNPYPLYRGTPLCNETMKKYIFMLAKESAATNKDGSMVAIIDDKAIAAGQIYKVPFLSEYWNMSIGALGHIVINHPCESNEYFAVKMLVERLVAKAKKDKFSFLSTSIPGPNIAVIRELEANFFRYAEGFVNMAGPTNWFREKFAISGLKIRDFVEDDLIEIDDAYNKVFFPSRFVSDGGFDKRMANRLYVNRFCEVYEQKIGKVFVAELDGKFAGAIIAIINEHMSKAIGINTNILSGMGIIIHPRAARRGVSMNLIEHRQHYFKSKGVEYVSFGANFNNVPMILGLDKIGLKYGSIDMIFHLWLQKK